MATESEKVTLRLPGDINHEIDELVDSNGMNKSEATRYFIRKGINADSVYSRISTQLKDMSVLLWSTAIVLFIATLFLNEIPIEPAMVVMLTLLLFGLLGSLLSFYFDPDISSEV